MRKSKLDIVLLSGSYPTNSHGGVATHVSYLAKALKDLTKPSKKVRVCKVHVLTTGQRERVGGEPPNLIIHELPGLNGYFFSEESFRNPGDIPLAQAVRYLLRNWHTIRADIIHAHDFGSIYIGIMLKAAYGVPLVATIHKAPKAWDPTSPERDTKDCFLEALRCMRAVDRFIAPSKAYKDRLLSQGFRKIEHITHGVPRRLAERSPSDVLENFNLQPDHEVILCPIRLDPYKDPEVVIYAAKILKNELPNRNLLFVIAGAGSGEYRGELEKRARDHSVDSIIRLGPINHQDVHPEDMARLYRRATLCVLPSRLEGFGQAVLEAFTFRKPVIGANVGGIAEVIVPGENGLLFNAQDPSDLADRIRRLLNDQEFSRKLALGGHKTVVKKYSAERMAKSYFNLYRKVARLHIK